MNLRLLLPLAGLLAASATAAVVEVHLPLQNLRLKDGLVFSNVAVKSINSVTDTAMLLVEKDLVSIRTSLLPEDVRAKLRELAPALSNEEQEAAKQQATADRQKALENAERRQRLAEEEAQAIRAANRTVNVKAATEYAAQREAIPGDVAKFAETRARAFFKYQDAPHSNIGAVISSDVFLENPEPVPGWSGRWRVEGIAYRQYINNQASGFGRSGQEFEILIQTREGRQPEIVEIRIK